MCICLFFFFFKQKTAYEMRISDWSSDVCSSDLAARLDSVRATRQSAAMPDASKTTSPTSAGAASGDADPLRAHGGFAALVGYALPRWEEDIAEVALTLAERHLNRSGVMHGGVLTTLIDPAGGHRGCPTTDRAPPPRALTQSLPPNYIGPKRTRVEWGN